MNLRSEFEKELRSEERKKKIEINEIRFREVGRQKGEIDKKVKIKITKYKASQGEEYFIEAVNKDNILFGLIRLRFPDNKNIFIDELKDCAIIRELHVYGKATEIGKIGKQSQHIGIGKLLMQKAEEIARKNKYNKVAVISGVGVRQYYKKLGYNLNGDYMIKKLNKAVH